MEDEFQLVSKEEFRKLKGELNALKESKEIVENPNYVPLDQKELAKEIIGLMKKEFANEKKTLDKTLNEIKELNKKTLDNLLHKTDDLNSRLEEVLITLKELIHALSGVVDEFSSTNNLTEIKELIADLSFDKNTQQKPETHNKQLENVEYKLEEINQFMNNLKTLLSQVKPNDMKLK